MKKHLIYIYWLLTLVPALLIGVGTLILLTREGQRQDTDRQQANERIAREKAALFANRVFLNLELAQNQLLNDVLRLDENQLEELTMHNPLVRNSFIWSPEHGLRSPSPTRPPSDEARRFITRYEPLFAGRIPWQKPPQETSSSLQSSYQNIQSSSSRQMGMGQDDVWNAQQMQTTQNFIPASTPTPRKSGWLPWFTDNRLYLLGWMEMSDKTVRGVELEMIAFISRLYEIRSDNPGEYSELLNGSGELLLSQGLPFEDSSELVQVTIPVHPQLPHWVIRCTYNPPSPKVNIGNSLVVAGSLIGATFIVSIIVGGVLLLRQSRRDALELQQKTSFVSNVSHELKTPLTSIRMYAELLGRKQIDDPAKRNRYLDVIVQESQRLSRLVNNVLDFSRLEQGKKKYQPVPIELNQLLRELLENQRLRLTSAGLEPSCELSTEELKIETDRDALEQVLINLLDNACKYAAKGKELLIQTKQTDGHAEIHVCDRGPGITGAHRKQIFEKFHRVDDSLTREQDGVGLGLSIAKRLMTDQAGELDYEDRPGGGACFIVRLPVH